MNPPPKPESNIRFESEILERISNAFVSLDASWHYNYVNKKAGEIFNRKPEDLVGKHIWTEFPEGVGQPFHLAYEKAMIEQRYVYLEEYYPPYDRWFENHIYPSPTGLSIYFKDITEKKKTELELELAKTNYLSFINNIDGIVWEADAKTFQFRFVSMQAQRLLGYPVEQWINEPTFWKDHIYENDRTWAVNYCVQCTKEKIAHEFEYRMVSSDGKLVWLRDIVTVQTENNEAVSLRGIMVDVTERKKVEAEIRKSNERFELIAKATNDAIWDWNMETDEIWGNETLYGFYGLDSSKDKIPSNLFYEHIHPDDVNRVKESMKRALIESVQSITEEFRFRIKDGSYRTVIDRAYVYYNKSGKPIRMLGAMQDITKRKVAEQEAEKERRDTTALINNTTDLLWSVSKDFKLIKANNAFIEGLLNNGGYLIKPGDDLLPEDRFPKEYLQYWKDLYSKGLSGEKVLTEIYTPQANTTEFLWFEIKIDPIHSANEITGVACSMRNITERKKSEKERIKEKQNFQSLVENISGVYWVNDLETYQTLYVSPSYEKIWGRKCEDLYKNPSDFINSIHPQDQPALFEAHKLIAEKQQLNIEYRIIRPGGELRWISAKTKVITQDDGKKIEYGYAEDITDIKRNEEAIKNSEQALKDAQRIAQTGSWELDLLTNQPKWSDEVYRILELNPQNISPDNEIFLNAIHPDDREAVTNAYTQSVNNRTGYDINHRLLFPDGQIKYVREQCETIYKEDGTPLRSIGTLQDITQEKRAEIALNESEKKYKNLFYNNPVPLWVINRENSQIIDVNEAAIKHYGYSHEEFLQMTSKQLRPPFEYERYDEFIKKYGRTIEGNIGIWNHVKKDGSHIQVELTVHSITYNNQPCRLVLANDITDKIKAEKRLEFLVSASPSVIYSAAADFPFGATFISQNIKEQTGYDPTDFTTNPDFWSDNIHPSDKERVIKDLTQIFTEGTFAHEYRFKLKDGSYTWMYDEIKLVYDSNGKPLEMIGYWIKINERKLAEEKIKQTNEQLRQLTTHLQKIREEERKRIGREIHDDLGQQLTAIKMDVAWVDKKIPEETTMIKNKLKNIISLLDGSNQSIRRILSELRPGILDDYGLLEALDWHGRQFTANTGIQVTINTNESEIKLSEPIATCLFRVYQEALTNISKHAHADKAIVSISINEETILMNISDNGKGFDDHSEKKRTSFGILGMKERVHSVKGDFELSSIPEMGTKISITIPLT